MSGVVLFAEALGRETQSHADEQRSAAERMGIDDESDQVP
jgi:hypothetical protein